MGNRAVKIVFKDNTNTTYKIKDTWLSNDNITDDIKYAMKNKLPYILNSNNLNFDNENDYDDTLIIPTENIKYIRIIGKQDEVEKSMKLKEK